jgi:gas vesicle protein
MGITLEYIAKQLKNVATKDDLLELPTKTEVRAMKDDIAEIKEIVKRVDRRTDEDTKAVMKDVANLQTRVRKLEEKAA